LSSLPILFLIILVEWLFKGIADKDIIPAVVGFQLLPNLLQCEKEWR
jgi:hypothetical protein